jgi:hypothetical protein
MWIYDGPSSIAQVLDCLVDQVDGDRVMLEDILRRLGTRSNGPGLILISTISMLPPISITPGLPMITGSVTLVLAAQLLVLRPYPWLPRRLLRVSFARENLESVVVRAWPWVEYIGLLVRPRLTLLLMPPFLNVIALICLGLGLMTFPLAVLPAGENIPAAAVFLFGLALTVGDGLLALFGLAAAGATVGALIYFWPTIVGLCMDLAVAIGF